MPYVLTVDQVASRERGDRVEDVLGQLAATATVLPFTRTVGDEFQGLLAEPSSVVDVILTLMRTGDWHIGLGIGPVEEPLPDNPRSARGPAFLAAREAVEAAKNDPQHVRVLAAPPAEESADDAEVVLRLLGALHERRTPEGWDAVDLAADGQTQAEIASRLGITRQAVGQRLRSAHWMLDHRTRPVLGRLLARVDQAAAEEGG